jgi:hypothetical protein
MLWALAKLLLFPDRLVLSDKGFSLMVSILFSVMSFSDSPWIELCLSEMKSYELSDVWC